MKWIKTGRKIGQAVKNVQRLRQILAVLVKHGFSDVIDRMNLGKYLPSRMTSHGEPHADVTTPERLRKSFEELGPTFVKLGQVLSTRSDLLPDSYIHEFVKLQDNVLPIDFSIVKKVIEEELGAKLETLYGSFDPKPLASASIAQVHEATLVTGEKVVVKVQRPEIKRVIETDVSLLSFLAEMLEKYIPESRIVGPKIIVDEFFRTLAQELDFSIEANNMIKFSENMRTLPDLVIPKTFKRLSSHKVLTLEKIEGIRVNDLKAIEAAGIDRHQVVSLGVKGFFKSILIDGLFHGDLHGGNLFILPGNRLGIIDFGIVGRLSEKSRDQLATMVMALITEDYEILCYQYAELGAAGPSVDFDGFQREVRNTISPYVGLSMKEVNSGKVLIEATRIATKYNIKVPGEWMMVFRALLTTEGMGRTLDPEFDMLAAGRELAKDLVKSQYSMPRISREALWVAKDVIGLMQVLPRQIRWMFKKFNSNDFAFEIKAPELGEIKDQLETNSKRLSSSIVGAGLFIASSIALNQTSAHLLWNYPVFSVIYFSAACLIVVKLFFSA